MPWTIKITESRKPGPADLGRTVQLETWGRADLTLARNRNSGICTAVACAQPECLALVFQSSVGVRLNGRKAACPVLAIGPRGGDISVRRSGGNVRLNVTHRFAPLVCRAADGLCCLCHDPLKEAPATQCPRCQRRYHEDCLQDCLRQAAPLCPNCRGSLTE
jgi:hypothetical protein